MRRWRWVRQKDQWMYVDKKRGDSKVVLVCDVIWDIMAVVYIGVVILLSECV